MGQLADKLDAMTITVASPDTMIRARVKAGRPEAVGFRPGAYESYQHAELQHQLARIAGLAFVTHQRGIAQLMDQFGVNWPDSPRQARSLAQKNYLADVAALTVVGPTENACVTFAIDGITNWRCRVMETALDELTEPEFVAATLAAATETVNRLTSAKARLKTRHLGRQRNRAA